MKDQVLVADRGDVNVFDVDLNVAVDAANDKVWFTVKKKRADLDTAAVSRHGLNVAGLTGIVATNPGQGIVQVTCAEAEFKSLTERVLLWDAQVKQGTRVTTVAKGTVRLSGEVTLSS